jgi:hypothetical protein
MSAVGIVIWTMPGATLAWTDFEYVGKPRIDAGGRVPAQTVGGA